MLLIHKCPLSLEIVAIVNGYDSFGLQIVTVLKDFIVFEVIIPRLIKYCLIGIFWTNRKLWDNIKCFAVSGLIFSDGIYIGLLSNISTATKGKIQYIAVLYSPIHQVTYLKPLRYNVTYFCASEKVQAFINLTCVIL